MDQKKYWREKLQPYTQKSVSIALWQLVNTIIPYMVLWYAYTQVMHISVWFVVPFSFIGSLFVLRAFVLMHDCGHGALFDSVKANKFFGYILGVITGMPQYVWSKHHAYHHTTNGNWEKYKGPLNITTTEKYKAFSEKQKRNYWLARHPGFLLIGGFYYVLFNPRFTWIMGSLSLLTRTVLSLNPFSEVKTLEVIKKCESKYWKTPKEFVHMSFNNLTLLPLWFVMCKLMGTGNFFLLYSLTLALSGALGILFFTMQHNFEKSYASDTAHVDYYRAALEGTSYLKLPFWLNWFTADIAYHHIHHLSTSVPNYHLARCHKDLRELFPMVRRVGLKDIPKDSSYLLWDMDKQVLVSLAELNNA